MGIIPAAARNLFASTPGPNAILVRTKGGNSHAALASLQSIGRRVDIAADGGSVFGVLRPAQILNYGSLGTTPFLLGAALSNGRTRSHMEAASFASSWIQGMITVVQEL